MSTYITRDKTRSYTGKVRQDFDSIEKTETGILYTFRVNETRKNREQNPYLPREEKHQCLGSKKFIKT